MKIVDMSHCAIGMAGWLFPASILPTQAQTLSTPPKGMEAGYVSIASRQEWGGSATQPRDH